MCTHFWFTGVAAEEVVFEPEPVYKRKVRVKSYLPETPPIPFSAFNFPFKWGSNCGWLCGQVGLAEALALIFCAVF